MGVVGADADALERLAQMAEGEAAELEDMYRGLSRKLHGSPWEGPAAERFRGRWSGEHGRQVRQAAVFLRESGRGLREQARQQREATGAGGGSIGWTSPPVTAPGDDPDLQAWVDQMKKILETLKLPVDKINEILGLLEAIDPSVRDGIVGLLGGDAFTSFLGIAGDALGMAGNVLNFVGAFAAHPELPFDEALVFAAGTMAIGFAVDQGVEFVASKLGAVLGTAIFPGGGTAAGYVIGHVVGIGLANGIDAIDDRFDLTDKGAMEMVKAYQGAKEFVADPGAAIRHLGDDIDHAVDNAVDIGKDVINGISDRVSDLTNDLPDWMRL